MRKYHPKYIIQQGDALQTITQRFGVAEDIWKQYHNNMCRLDDVIKDALPQHLKEIYLLPELWEREPGFNSASANNEAAAFKIKEGIQNKDNKRQLLTSWAVYPRADSLNHAYWFRYIIEDEETETEIRYKILVRYIQQEKENTSLYLIHRISGVYINDDLPTLCMDELAYETGQVFYPMVVEVDEKAQWVALRNYQQIKKNWFNTVRPSVGLRFAGDIGLKYLARMDKVMESKDRMEEILKKDLFFRFYFGTFYHSYSQQFETDRVLEFHAGNSSPVLFKVKCRLNRNLTDKGYKEITQTGAGITCDVSEEQDKFTEVGQTFYSARILLEAKTNCVREAEAEWITEDTRRKTKLILYPLRWQCKDEFDIKIDKVNNNKSLLSGLFG